METVADNACRNCHETHQTGGGAVLLRYAAEEENCAACHDGSVAEKDVMASFGRPRHGNRASALVIQGDAPSTETRAYAAPSRRCRASPSFSPNPRM